MGGEMGTGVHTVIAVWSCLMRWLGNRAQGCLSVCVSVCACVLTDGLARDKKLKEEGERYVHPVCTCVTGGVCMSNEVAVVKGDRAGLCK